MTAAHTPSYAAENGAEAVAPPGVPSILLGLLGSLLMISSPFLVWARLGARTARGLDRWPGLVTLGVAVVVVALLLLCYARRVSAALWFGAFFAMVGLGLSLWYIVGLPMINNQVGPGVYVLLGGSVLVVGGALLSTVLPSRPTA